MNSIEDLVEQAAEFVRKLETAKAGITGRQFDWYPYPSLSNLRTFDSVLTGPNRRLLDLIGGAPVLDIGCADGDLAFFLESLGVRVDAIDHPIPNFNAMQGVRALKRELGSKVAIHSLDLDGRFELPDTRYGLAILLGILYHLKNPFYLLEKLSRQAGYCLLSTAITDSIGGPAAYLAGDWEINGDSTNYWICSDAGLQRLLQRTNWELCDYQVFDTGPVPIANRRAFALVRSKFEDRPVHILYGNGWHALEGNGWRWTERRFSIRVESSRAARRNELLLRLYVQTAPVTLRAAANGVELDPATFSEVGEYEYRRALTDFPAADGDIRIDFRLDRALPPDAADKRERGIIVAGIAVDISGLQRPR